MTVNTMTPEEQMTRDELAKALEAGYSQIIREADEWRPIADHMLAALRTAREEGIQEGVEAAIEWPHEHGEPLTTQNVDRLYAAIRAREKQT